MCWEETREEGQETPVKQHTANSASKSDVVYIQDLSAVARRKQRDDEIDSGLLAVYADGHVRFLSEDLQKHHWDFVLPSHKTGTTGTVVFAATESAATARKAVFNHRSDIALPSESVDAAEDIILVVVSQTAAAYNVQFISVPVVAGKKSPRELLSLQLPTGGEISTGSTFSVHFPTGTLYELSATHLTTYNLTTSQPSIIATLPIKFAQVPGAHPTSLLRISSSTVLVATNEEISLYDTKFSSLQATVSIQSSVPSSVALSRSSTPGAGMSGSVFLTTYIQDMDLVLGYGQSGIVGIQLIRARGSAGEKKGGLLIDSLGRGVGGLDSKPAKKGKSANPLMKKLESEKLKANKAIAELSRAQAKGDVAAFERVFAKYVGLPVDVISKTACEDAVNGDKAVARREVELGVEIPESAFKPLRTDFVTAVLSMIFAVTEPASAIEEQQMVVSIFPPNVLRYLLESGNFSTLSLPLKEGLVRTLLAHDPSLRTLQWFLTSLNDLPAAEVLSAIDLALSPSTAAPEGEDNVVFEIHRAEIVRVALIRLEAFPASSVINSLKTLPSDSLVLLIRLLENELIPDEDGNDEPGKTIGIEDVRVVADLLTAALDAVGMSGLVMTESTDMLSGLMENVEDALDMVEQAADLKGLMEEMFRHVDWKGVVENEEAQKLVAAQSKKDQGLQKAAFATTTTTAGDEKALTSTSHATSAFTVKKQPMVNRSQDKHRRRSQTAQAHKVALARVKAMQKTVVGHKKMLRRAAMSKEELIKQDRPVALTGAKGISPILPLGALSLRRLVDPLVGKEFKMHETEQKKNGTMKREYWREGLAAGAYSVESMVV